MKYNPKVFREYDIRGYVGDDLSEEFAYKLGHALAEFSKKKEQGNKSAIIGWDCRESSPSYANALAQGLVENGFNVEMIGMVPTPVVYHAQFKKSSLIAVAVTGSHNPKNMNGFKMVVNGRAISGTEIQEVRSIYERLTPIREPSGQISNIDYLAEYISDLTENIRPYLGNHSVKITLDYGNGVGGLSMKPILANLNVTANHLLDDPNPDFPVHHPDPSVEENLELLKQNVKSVGGVGFAFDGDADRIGLVTETGRVVPGDIILLILAKEILKTQPGGTVIGDVKCSDILFNEIKRLGGKPLMWKTGHSLIKAKMKETNAILAGEMSGHIFIKHRYYGFDDAVYSALRIIEMLSNGFNLLEFLNSLPTVYNTPEFRKEVPEDIKFQAISELSSRFSGYDVDTTDGIRINFDQGWALVRASNTQPAIIMRFEAKSQEKLHEIETLVKNTVDEVLESLT